jgi:hypothetical protein
MFLALAEVRGRHEAPRALTVGWLSVAYPAEAHVAGYRISRFPNVNGYLHRFQEQIALIIKLPYTKLDEAQLRVEAA